MRKPTCVINAMYIYKKTTPLGDTTVEVSKTEMNQKQERSGIMQVKMQPSINPIRWVSTKTPGSCRIVPVQNILCTGIRNQDTPRLPHTRRPDLPRSDIAASGPLSSTASFRGSKRGSRTCATTFLSSPRKNLRSWS